MGKSLRALYALQLTTVLLQLSILFVVSVRGGALNNGTDAAEPSNFISVTTEVQPPKRVDMFPPDWGVLGRSRRVLIFL